MKRIIYTLASVMLSVGAWAQTSLQEQIDSATDGSTITLTENVTIDKTILIGKNITIDGGGHTITSNVTNNLGTFYINVTSSNFSITNAVIDGGSTASMAVVAYRGVAISDFSGVESVVNNNTGNVITLSGCTVKNFTGYPNSYVGAIYAFSTSTFNLNNCSFTGNTTTKSSDGASGADVWAGAAATVNIKGGSYQEVFVNSNAGDHASITISNGATVAELAVCVTEKGEGVTNQPAITVDGATVTNITTETGNIIPSSAVIIQNGGKVNNIPTAYVAQIGDKKFNSLAAAIESAEAGQTITLLEDITTSIVDEFTITKALTLNLAGHTITSTVEEPFLVKATGDLTITGNGTIAGPTGEDGKVRDGKAMITVEGGKLTYLNGTLTCGGVGSDGMYGVYILDNGTAIFGNDSDKTGPSITSWFAAIGENNTTAPANITVYGGSYTSQASPTDSDWWSYFCAPVYAAASGAINIYGGAFNGYYGLSSRYGNVDQNLNIQGGTFTGTKQALFIDNKSGVESSASRDVAVSGGTFSSAVSAEYCANGFVPKDNGDGTYGVKEGTYVAQIDDKNYESLADAIAAATEGQMIKLLVDQTVSSELTIGAEKNLTIDLNGKIVIANKITNDGTLVVKSSVDGGKITRSGIVITNNANLTIESGIFEATANTTLGVIYNKGTFTMNGGEILAKTNAIRADNNSIMTTINGGNISTTGNNAIYMGGGKCNITAGTLSSSDINVILYNSAALKASVPVTSNVVTTLSDGYSYTLGGALKSAEANSTVTLDKDAVLTTEATVDKNLTLNLNGHNISSTKTALTVTSGVLTISGEGTVKGAVENAKGGKNIFYPTVYANGGNIVIDGGTYDDGGVDEYGFPTIYADGSSTITINAGTFKNSATSQGGKYWVLNTKDNSGATISVTGGAFYNFDPANNKNEGSPSNLGTNYVADGYITVMSESGSDKIYTVTTGQWVATIADETIDKFRFASLDEAITTANGVSKDVTVTILTDAIATVEPSPNVTINADGKMLTLPTFKVADGESLVYHKVINATDNLYKVTKATYNRSGAVGTKWGTVCLPFSIENEPTGYTLYTPTAVSTDVLTVDAVTYPVAAGTSVIFFKDNTEEVTMSSANASIKINGAPIAQSGSLVLVGTYTNQTINTGLENIYFINGDKFHQAKASLNVPAYRAYINNTSAGAKASVLNIVVAGGEVNGIEAVTSDATVTAIYDANGRQLTAPQKGMNIMKLANGKTVKIIVK